MMWQTVHELGKSCSKGMLLSLNLIIILLALFSLGLAAVDASILKQYGEEESKGTFAGDMVIIAACILLIVIAVIGCAGTWNNNVRILYLYSGLLMILVLLELMIGLSISMARYGLEFRITDWIREDFFRNVTGPELVGHQKMWDDLQTSYECCGLNGPHDYTAMHEPIMLSCCPNAYRARTPLAQQQLYSGCLAEVEYHQLGCEDVILDSLREEGQCLLSAAIVCFWFEAAGILLAMSMANNLKLEDKIYKEVLKY